MIGTIQTVLVTHRNKRDVEDLNGRTENNRSTFFTSDNDDLIGKFVQVRITKAYANSLRGELVNEELAY